MKKETIYIIVAILIAVALMFIFSKPKVTAEIDL